MQNQSKSKVQRHARALRREMTDSERHLWSRLRGEQLGVKFRRQHPFGAYVADFVCLEPKLIVELDGSQHVDQIEYDAVRDRFFRAHGFEVLRFAIDEPLRNRDGVCTVILETLNGLAARAPPPPPPPPPGGGAKKRAAKAN